MFDFVEPLVSIGLPLEADYKVRDSNVIPQSGAPGLPSQRLFPFTVDPEDGFDFSPTVFTAITR